MNRTNYRKKIAKKERHKFIDSDEYFETRKIISDWIKKDRNIDGAITKIYRETLEKVEYRLYTYIAKYAREEGISIAEAKKLVDNFDVTKWQMSAAQAVKEKDFSKEANAWLKIYNLKMKMSREELLRAEISLELAKMTSKLDNVMTSHAFNVAKEEIKRQAGILKGHELTASKIKNIVNADFYGTSFSEKIWGRNGVHGRLQSKLFDELLKMTVDEGNYKTAIRSMRKRFEVSEYEAKRLIKTESSRIRNQASLSMYQENGFTHYVWVCEPSACPTCKVYDGLEMKIEESGSGYIVPPLHPNCMCSTYGKIDYIERLKREELI